MTKEELEKEAYDYTDKYWGASPSIIRALKETYVNSAEPREKRIAELEKENAELQEKISVLLSCKKCPENKGGWICVKEYENKCLSQKIVYIKELKKENAELKAFRRDCIKLTEDNIVMAKQRGEIAAQLTKAKEIIKEMLSILPKENIEGVYEIIEEAEQFISEVEK